MLRVNDVNEGDNVAVGRVYSGRGLCSHIREARERGVLREDPAEVGPEDHEREVGPGLLLRRDLLGGHLIGQTKYAVPGLARRKSRRFLQ